MSPAFVFRRVLHDAREKRAAQRFLRQIPADCALQKRAECILYAIDGVFAGEPFAPRERTKRVALRADDLGQIEDDVVGRGHRFVHCKISRAHDKDRHEQTSFGDG